MATRRAQSSADPNDRNKAGRHSSGLSWSDEELRHAVGVYVLLLRLQSSGVDHGGEGAAQALLGGALNRRNAAAIRYRMRNISAIIKELGSTELRYFSPAEQVGNHVRSRIREMLLADADFVTLQAGQQQAREIDRSNAIAALMQLREQISAIERELIGIGHNGPPEPIDGHAIDRKPFADALHDIATLEDGLKANEADANSIEASKSRWDIIGQVVW